MNENPPITLNRLEAAVKKLNATSNKLTLDLELRSKIQLEYNAVYSYC